MAENRSTPRLREDSTVLGGKFSNALYAKGSTTFIADAAAGYDLGRGWSIAERYRHGWTMVGKDALVTGGKFNLTQ
jgi:hypothetical protein